MSTRRTADRRHAVSLWLPVAAFLALSFYLSSRPGGDLPKAVPDYVAHAVQFAILGLLALRAFNGGTSRRPSPLTCVLAVSLCVVWAVSDEYHQSMVPGRHASAIDVLSDLVGALLACALFPWIRRFRPRQAARI